MFVTTLISFLVYWLLIFVVNYIVVEYGQNYLYDEPTPGFGARSSWGVSPWRPWPAGSGRRSTRCSPRRFHWTVLMALAWVLVFTLLYQFHPPHALLIGLTAMVIVPGLATMTAESLTRPRQTLAPTNTGRGGPVRRPISGTTPAKPLPP